VDRLSEEALAANVAAQLKDRYLRPVSSRHTPGGGSLQRATTSSGFLARRVRTQPVQRTRRRS
jgi:hypothetical protein